MYTQREPLAGAAQDRVISIFSLQNLVGGVMAGGVTWGLTNAVGLTGTGFSLLWAVQILVILGGGILGAVLTVRWSGGLSTWDKLMLHAMFTARRASGGHRVVPPPVTVAQVAAAEQVAILDDDGTVLAQPYRPQQGVSADG